MCFSIWRYIGEQRHLQMIDYLVQKSLEVIDLVHHKQILKVFLY